MQALKVLVPAIVVALFPARGISPRHNPNVRIILASVIIWNFVEMVSDCASSFGTLLMLKVSRMLLYTKRTTALSLPVGAATISHVPVPRMMNVTGNYTHLGCWTDNAAGGRQNLCHQYWNEQLRSHVNG